MFVANFFNTWGQYRELKGGSPKSEEFDLYSDGTYHFEVGEIKVVKTGTTLQLSEGCDGIIHMILSGFDIENNVINQGYTGQIMVTLINNSGVVQNITDEDRIARLMVIKQN